MSCHGHHSIGRFPELCNRTQFFITVIVMLSFRDYFEEKFNAIATPKQDSIFGEGEQARVKRTLQVGQSCPIQILREAKIALDKFKLALISKCDTDLATKAVQEAKDLIAKRKRKNKSE